MKFSYEDYLCIVCALDSRTSFLEEHLAQFPRTKGTVKEIHRCERLVNYFMSLARKEKNNEK